ncbi:MAG: tetratricopeptide repeat protein [Dongiaceae bacterium]
MIIRALFLILLIYAPPLAAADLRDAAQAITERRAFDDLARRQRAMNIKDPFVIQGAGAKILLRKNPRDLRALEILCEAYFNKGFINAAAGTCREALRINAQAPSALTTMAEIALRDNDRQQAKMYIDQALLADKNFGRARIVNAKLLQQDNQKGLALAELEKAVALSPNPDSLIRLGEIYSQNNRHQEARDRFLQALQMDSKNIQALTYLSSSYESLGDRNRALDFAKEAVKTDPKSSLAQLSLGTRFENMGRLDEAIAQYRLATRIEPSLAPAQRQLANALMKRGDALPALEAYGKILSKNPKDQEALLGSAKAYEILGNPAAAEEMRQQSQKLKPASVAASVASAALAPLPNWIAQGKAQENQGNFEAARQIYEQAAINNPVDAEAYFHLGRVYTIAQDWGNAERFLNQANSLRPNNAAVLRELSMIYCHRGDGGKARATYTQALQAGLSAQDEAGFSYLQAHCPPFERKIPTPRG